MESATASLLVVGYRCCPIPPNALELNRALQESAASFVGVHGADNWYDNQWDAVLAATLKTPLAAMKE